MHKPLAVFALVLVTALGACVAPASLDHHRSQARLDEGLAQLVKARSDVVDLARAGSPKIEAIGTASLSISSVQTARLALARDAERDYALATGAFAARQPSDRISLLFRASSKAWNAGRNTDADLVQKIAAAGAAACKGDNFNLAPRDCQIIAIAPQLTAMQSAADIIFDMEIDWIVDRKDGISDLSVADMNGLIAAIGTLDARSDALDRERLQSTLTGAAMRPDLRRFVEQFQVQSWCHAVVAATLIPNALDVNGNKIGLEARGVLTGSRSDISSALAAALKQGKLSGSDIDGMYEAYSEDMLALAGVTRTNGGDVSGHRALCSA